MRKRERVLVGVGLATIVLAALRGAGALVGPAWFRGGGDAIGVVLCVMVVAGVAALAFGARARTRADALDRDLCALAVIERLVGSAGEARGAGRYRVSDPSAEPAAPFAPPRAAPGTWAVRGFAVATVIAAVVGITSMLDSGAPPPRRWTFTEGGATPAEHGLHTPIADAGEWLVEHHEHATGACALLNRAGLPGAPAATALVGGAARNALAATRCKVAPDRPAGACGLVLRYRDAGHHYVARVDAGQSRVVLAVVASGREVVVFWNGRRVIAARDGTLRGEGAIGLWAPSDAIVWFDELAVHPLTGAPDPVQAPPFLRRDA